MRIVQLSKMERTAVLAATRCVLTLGLSRDKDTTKRLVKTATALKRSPQLQVRHGDAAFDLAYKALKVAANASMWSGLLKRVIQRGGMLNALVLPMVWYSLVVLRERLTLRAAARAVVWKAAP